MTQINIPLSCPICDGKMYAVSYEPPLRLLKERTWQVCKECRYEQTAEDFKRRLLTA